MISVIAQIPVAATVLMVAAALIVGAVLAVLAAKLIGSQTIGSARRQAEQVVRDGQHEAENLKKQLELDWRTEQAKRREQFDKEISIVRNEARESEQRLTKREDNLDRKLDVLTTKERYLDELDSKVKAREAAVAARDAELQKLITQEKEVIERSTQEQKQTLLRLSGLNPEEARKEALRLVEQEVQHEAGQLIQREMARAEEEAKENSLRITLQAIQRYASEHTADNTVTSIDIASDDMKGRVIGREGRNIRAFEKATGVDVIVDDTPGVVVVSCFDPVRRAVAAESLRKLLEDGRIHPARIEEVVEQMDKEIKQRIIRYGKEAAIEADIQGLHPKVCEMMGRLYYRTSYGQNILRHAIEVAYLCQVIADELHLDGALARRCGFLHDIGKAMDHEVEGGHPAIGAEFCKKLGEREEVINAIAAHHNDIPSTSPYTPIVMAADTISGARPGARRETLEKYIKRLEQLEGIATSLKGVKQAFAIQAGREVRVIVDPDTVTDADCHYIARDIAKRVSDEMTFPGEIRVTVLREMRTVEMHVSGPFGRHSKGNAMTNNRPAPIAIFVAALVAATSTWAQQTQPSEAAPSERPAPQTLAERFSYGLGAKMGTDIKQQGMPLDPRWLAAGLTDALTGQPLVLSLEEIDHAVAAVRNEMLAQRAQQAQINASRSREFLQQNAQKGQVKTAPSGLQYEVIKDSSGATPTGLDTVRVNYTGKLIDGTVFDSSERHGEPATFRVDQVIPGWTQALQMMKVGSTWRLYVPPELAYGEQGAGAAIGPNQALIFDVELLEIVPPTVNQPSGQPAGR